MKNPIQKFQFSYCLCTLFALAINNTVIAKSETDSIAFHPVPLSSTVFPASVNDETFLSLSLIKSPTDQSYTKDASDEFLEASITQYRESIRETEYREGPFTIMLAQQLETLADLLQKSGDNSSAIETYKKSLHIIRINNGLYDLQQFSVLEKLIETQLALNNVEQAHELHKSLFHMKKRLYSVDDSNYVAAILEWADWNINLLIQEDYGFQTDNQKLLLNQNLVVAQDSYIEAIGLIRNSDNYSAKDQLVHAEKKLAAINYFANNLSFYSQAGQASYFVPENTGKQSKQETAYFFNGSNALKRAIAYSLESPAPDYLYIAEQIMALGDWYLLFDRRAAALTVYEDAFEVLDAIQAGEDKIQHVMTPGMPVIAPGMDNNTFGSPTHTYAGYIDVKFTVSKFGIASHPEVIGASHEDVSPVSKALIQKIRREKFRPSFIDGSPSGNENVQLRYYYSYN